MLACKFRGFRIPTDPPSRGACWRWHLICHLICLYLMPPTFPRDPSRLPTQLSAPPTHNILAARMRETQPRLSSHCVGVASAARWPRPLDASSQSEKLTRMRPAPSGFFWRITSTSRPDPDSLTWRARILLQSLRVGEGAAAASWALGVPESESGGRVLGSLGGIWGFGEAWYHEGRDCP